MFRIAIAFLSLSLLGGCVNTLGHSFERNASLSRAPAMACVEPLVKRVAAPSAVTHDHRDRNNQFSGRLRWTTDSYTVRLGGLDEFRAIQAGAQFHIILTRNVSHFDRTFGGAGDYRLRWYHGDIDAGREDEIRRMALAVEEGLVAECGAAFSGAVRESTSTDYDLHFAPV